MAQTLKLVFSNHKYLVLAAIISIGLFVPLSIVSEYIFLTPYLVMDIPSDRAIGFSLIVAVSVLSGIVIAMNVYRVTTMHNQARKMGGGLIGSIIGASAGACSCGPIGFAIISTFGTTAGIA
ncbi:MAG: hypothetical protein WD154_07795, partial [Nitrosopumilaceae archaeon]